MNFWNVIEVILALAVVPMVWRSFRHLVSRAYKAQEAGMCSICGCPRERCLDAQAPK